MIKPQYIFSCKAGEVIKEKLPKEGLKIFASFFQRYCFTLKNIQDIKNNRVRFHLMRLIKKEGENKLNKLFDGKNEKFPLWLKSHAHNAFVCVYRKYLKGEK